MDASLLPVQFKMSVIIFKVLHGMELSYLQNHLRSITSAHLPILPSQAGKVCWGPHQSKNSHFIILPFSGNILDNKQHYFDSIIILSYMVLKGKYCKSFLQIIEFHLWKRAIFYTYCYN